jgi:REP element-mobilizing transposase RayT
MGDKFRDKYRVPSARAQWWDYSSEGLYFITICIKNRENILGKINNGQMVLSDFDKIVMEESERSFEIRNELFCEIYVIMPNHIHSILRIENNETHGIVETHGRASHDRIESHGRASLRHGVAYRVPKSISSFVAGFKSAATSRINQLRNSPGKPVWQTRFHDRIVRDHQSFLTIYNYILNNPSKWHEDTFFIPE